MRDEVDRREIGLHAALAELREVRIPWKAEHLLEDRREQRLGQDLLVGAGGRGVDVRTEAGGASKRFVPPHLRVETALELLHLSRDYRFALLCHRVQVSLYGPVTG